MDKIITEECLCFVLHNRIWKSKADTMVNKFHEKAKPIICLIKNQRVLSFQTVKMPLLSWHGHVRQFYTKLWRVLASSLYQGVKQIIWNKNGFHHSLCCQSVALSLHSIQRHKTQSVLYILCFYLLQKTQYCCKADWQCSFHNEIVTHLVNSAFVRDYSQLWIDTHLVLKLLWKNCGTNNKIYINNIC